MWRIILCCAGAIVDVSSAQAAPSDLSKRRASESAPVDRGQDFADGIFGPDFWEVTGVGAGDVLNMRSAPSPRSTLVSRFENGAVLRNLGCKISYGARWCRIEQPGDPGVRGWVNGRYLSEAAGQN